MFLFSPSPPARKYQKTFGFVVFSEKRGTLARNVSNIQHTGWKFLTLIMLQAYYHISRNHKKTCGFLMFLGGIQRYQCHEICQVIVPQLAVSQNIQSVMDILKKSFQKFSKGVDRLLQTTSFGYSEYIISLVSIAYNVIGISYLVKQSTRGVL